MRKEYDGQIQSHQHRYYKEIPRCRRSTRKARGFEAPMVLAAQRCTRMMIGPRKCLRKMLTIDQNRDGKAGAETQRTIPTITTFDIPIATKVAAIKFGRNRNTSCTSNRRMA